LTLTFETQGSDGVNPDVAKNDVSDSTTMEVTNASRSDIKVSSISYKVCPSSVDMSI
jgi:fructose-specific phosphotransferase system component IIB